MGEFRYVPAGEVAQRHRAKEAPPRQGTRGTVPQRRPEQKNVEQVLAIGAVRYITFHDRTFRIPPVPFRLGQRVLQVYVQSNEHARAVALSGKKEYTDKFYQDLELLAKLMWQHIRPVGKIRRFFWRIGLMRNPFRKASEGEMRAICDFFLQDRMKSSVRSMSETEAQA